MRVRVKKGHSGFNGRARVHEGAEFDIPDNVRPGKWMDVIKGPAKKQWWQKPKAEKVPADKVPAAFAELAKQVASMEVGISGALASLEGRIADLEAQSAGGPVDTETAEPEETKTD